MLRGRPGRRSPRPRPPAPCIRRPGCGSSSGSASRSSSSSRALRPALAVGGGARRRRRRRPAGRGLPARSQRMDDAWLATLAGKDYLFATDWGVVPWLLNAAYPVMIVGDLPGPAPPRADPARASSGWSPAAWPWWPRSSLTLPLVASHVAVAVQLQVSRVFWMADLLAMLGVVWWLAEARRRTAPAGRRHRPPPRRRPRWAFAARRHWPSAAAATRCSSSIPSARCSRCRRRPTPGPTSRATCAGPRRPAPTSSPTPTMPGASARRSGSSPPATCSWRTSRTRR